MKSKSFLILLVIVINFKLIIAQETPQPVYNFRSNYSTGLMFQVSNEDEKYVVEFTSTKWKIIETYFDLLNEAVKGQTRVRLLFDFEPPLNEYGEFEVSINERNRIEITNQGFSVSIKKSKEWSWSNYNYNRLMLYIKED